MFSWHARATCMRAASVIVSYKLILNIIFIANSVSRCNLEFSCFDIIARTTLGVSNSYVR